MFYVTIEYTTNGETSSFALHRFQNVKAAMSNCNKWNTGDENARALIGLIENEEELKKNKDYALGMLTDLLERYDNVSDDYMTECMQQLEKWYARHSNSDAGLDNDNILIDPELDDFEFCG